jgi:hypothetical protein
VLEANNDNSSKIMESFSIGLSNEGIILFSSFNFKLMEISRCKTSLRSQCPWDWLRTHAKIIGERQSTIIKKMCQVRGGGTRLVTLTTIC